MCSVTLLDRQAGSFRLAPFGINVPTARIYEPGTNIVATTWKTPTGWILVRDALTMGPRHGEDEITPHTRPPADDDGDHMLVRTVVCLEGSVEVELICDPNFDYGRIPAEWSLVGDDRHRADASGGDLPLRLQTDLALGIEGDWVRARHTLAAGRAGVLCAVLGRGSRRTTRHRRGQRHGWPPPLDSGAVGWDGRGFPTIAGATRSSARRWRSRASPTCRPEPRSPPLTTSLPETPGGERNWDYRFTWIRDSTFTLQALHFLDLDWEADEFMQFVADLEPNEDGGLQIMYGIDGRRDLTESTRDELSGYAGAHPVRLGNGAFDQRQNDVFGAALDSILLHTRRSSRLPRRLWPIVQAQAKCATPCGATPTRASGRPAATRSTTCRPS